MLLKLEDVAVKYGYGALSNKHGATLYIKPVNRFWSLAVLTTKSKKHQYPQVEAGTLMLPVEELLVKVFQSDRHGITYLTFSKIVSGIREHRYNNNEDHVYHEISSRLNDQLNFFEQNHDDIIFESENCIDNFVENKYFPIDWPMNPLCHYHLIRKIVKHLIETGSIDNSQVCAARKLLEGKRDFLEAFDLQYDSIKRHLERTRKNAHDDRSENGQKKRRTAS